MKKTAPIIAVIIILVILFGVGGMLFMKSSKTPSTTQTTNTQATKPQTTNSLKGTIIGLLSGGKNVNCQITYPENKGTGTVYVSDKKFAGDFTMKGTDGKETTGHMVSDGTFMYVWSSGISMGIKMNLAEAKSAAQKAGANANQSIDVNQEVNLNCNPWAPDNSKFTVPTDIQFKDMSKLLEQVAPQTTGKTVTPQTGTENGNSSPCDQITDPTAKAACTKALQGNGY
jgi:hypothetical protein